MDGGLPVYPAAEKTVNVPSVDRFLSTVFPSNVAKGVRAGKAEERQTYSETGNPLCGLWCDDH
jgi:hypothetical protein